MNVGISLFIAFSSLTLLNLLNLLTHRATNVAGQRASI
jgi:hypothetical protein